MCHLVRLQKGLIVGSCFVDAVLPNWTQLYTRGPAPALCLPSFVYPTMPPAATLLTALSITMAALYVTSACCSRAAVEFEYSLALFTTTSLLPSGYLSNSPT